MAIQDNPIWRNTGAAQAMAAIPPQEALLPDLKSVSMR